jgi:hypothetical protein
MLKLNRRSTIQRRLFLVRNPTAKAEERSDCISDLFLRKEIPAEQILLS